LLGISPSECHRPRVNLRRDRAFQTPAIYHHAVLLLMPRLQREPATEKGTSGCHIESNGMAEGASGQRAQGRFEYPHCGNRLICNADSVWRRTLLWRGSLYVLNRQLSRQPQRQGARDVASALWRTVHARHCAGPGDDRPPVPLSPLSAFSHQVPTLSPVASHAQPAAHVAFVISCPYASFFLAVVPHLFIDLHDPANHGFSRQHE
jgi:hypothetical protein